MGGLFVAALFSSAANGRRGGRHAWYGAGPDAERVAAQSLEAAQANSSYGGSGRLYRASIEPETPAYGPG